MRWLFYALLVLWFMWRLQRLSQSLRNASRGTTMGGAGRSQRVVETLERCHRCDVHIPQSQALAMGRGRYACSEECRQASRES